MAVETLFGQAFTQTGEATDADTGWTFATQMSSSNPAAFVRAIWWAPPTSADGAYDYRVYSGHIGETRTLIASGSLGAYTANNVWQRFPITPVDVSGLNFMVAVRSADGHDDAYAYATGKWPASSGSLTGPGSSGGAFSTSGGTPDNGSALFFMLDAEVAQTAADVTAATIDATGPAATATTAGDVQVAATAAAVAAAATAVINLPGTRFGSRAPFVAATVDHRIAGSTVAHLFESRTNGDVL